MWCRLLHVISTYMCLCLMISFWGKYLFILLTKFPFFSSMVTTRHFPIRSWLVVVTSMPPYTWEWLSSGQYTSSSFISFAKNKGNHSLDMFFSIKMIPIYIPINRNSDALYHVTWSLVDKCQHLAAFNHVVSCTLPRDSAKCIFSCV